MAIAFSEGWIEFKPAISGFLIFWMIVKSTIPKPKNIDRIEAMDGAFT